MKRILTYAALCSLILTAYGCRTEEEPVPETGRIRMTFSSTSGDHDTRTGINETEDGIQPHRRRRGKDCGFCRKSRSQKHLHGPVSIR